MRLDRSSVSASASFCMAADGAKGGLGIIVVHLGQPSWTCLHGRASLNFPGPSNRSSVPEQDRQAAVPGSPDAGHGQEDVQHELLRRKGRLPRGRGHLRTNSPRRLFPDF